MAKHLPSFEELYERMQEAQAMVDDKSALSHSEMGSPRDFQSDISATPKGGAAFGGLNIQTPKGAIGGHGMNAPISVTNASRPNIDMSQDVDSSMGSIMPPQTPAGKVVPSLDMAKLGSGSYQPPQSTTNKGSGRLLLQSPSAANARNMLAERSAVGNKDGNADGVNKRELPNSEFTDFLQTYDETVWQKKEEEKKKEDEIQGKTGIGAAIIDGIKEEEGEGSGDSDDEVDKTKQENSPDESSNSGSEKNLTMVGEGDDNEDTFLSLDEALEADFDINKVSKLEQRLKDINRQPRLKNDLYPFRLQLLSKRVKKCKQCSKKIVAPGDQARGQMLMNSIIPKVTIYRIGKLDDQNPSPFVDLLLMIRNPNNSKAKVGFSKLTPEQMTGQEGKIIV